LVNTVERRDTFGHNSPTGFRRWSLEQGNDQTWQGRLILVVVAVLRVLERQSYLLALIAMLVNYKQN